MPESSQKSEIRSSLLKYAANILSRRTYFRFKLREKLFLRAEKLNLSNSDSTINSILDDLAKSGYLNDQYLSEAFVRRQLSKHYGPRIISLKLKFLGLSREAVTEALSSSASLEAEIASIRQYLQKFPLLDHRKLISKLYQRGYSDRAIKSAFDGGYLED
ncbi:MAG: Regulatory protein RecX [Candidatus Woesebacteria bacterium GW2011_GWA2_44_33]|uniref:Regulatory protein RecX n=1 Tax=Candidatus Woesebacteria bacterium GW2011_GWA2_44_33 TaxID=1618564 RepID=A0A0G1M656_9BACT|nr:MAG: Regulatory protein RecX [Candidatus Woesebacteria bacterium GW2011_GWA2_44_33]